jgi:predicted ATP-dependent protease
MFSRILLCKRLIGLATRLFCPNPTLYEFAHPICPSRRGGESVQKQVNMEAIAQLHQQNQCAAFFAQEQVKSQINQVASQASHQAAAEAQQLGSQRYCQQASVNLGSLLK